jgi:hypothetical protein
MDIIEIDDNEPEITIQPPQPPPPAQKKKIIRRKVKNQDETIKNDNSIQKKTTSPVTTTRKRCKNGTVQLKLDPFIKRKDIVLKDWQTNHVVKLNSILQNSWFACDFSMMGDGKTFTSSFLHQSQKDKYKKIITITPATVKTKWMQVHQEYDIDICMQISYGELSSKKFKQPIHGLLIRRDYIHRAETTTTGEFREEPRVEFTVTQAFKNLVEEGILLVIDEIQAVKNSSANQTDACRTLIKYIKEKYKTTSSRVLLLSGSPIDEEEHTITLFKTLNIFVADYLSVYNPQTYRMMWRGMREIEDYCLNEFCAGNNDIIQSVKIQTLVETMRRGYQTRSRFRRDQRRHPNQNYNQNEDEAARGYDVRASYDEYNRGRLQRRTKDELERQLERHLPHYVYRLFMDIFKTHRVSQMVGRKNPFPIYKHNAFYKEENAEMIELLKKGIANLKRSTRYANGQVNFRGGGTEALAAIVHALQFIETAKIQLFIRIINEALDLLPTQKVVLCVNYTETVNDVLTALKHHNPLRLDGSLTTEKKFEVINKFQQPNSTYRLIVGNVRVLSSGIDLDDKDGGFPRLCLVSPNYSANTLYQLAHRFQRGDTKSDSFIHMVYVENYNELPILDALARKGAVMKECTEKQVEAGVVFPGEYSEWYESGNKNNQSNILDILAEEDGDDDDVDDDDDDDDDDGMNLNLNGVVEDEDEDEEQD